jgi:hypothetical protein
LVGQRSISVSDDILLTATHSKQYCIPPNEPITVALSSGTKASQMQVTNKWNFTNVLHKCDKNKRYGESKQRILYCKQRHRSTCIRGAFHYADKPNCFSPISCIV